MTWHPQTIVKWADLERDILFRNMSKTSYRIDLASEPSQCSSGSRCRCNKSIEVGQLIISEESREVGKGKNPKSIKKFHYYMDQPGVCIPEPLRVATDLQSMYHYPHDIPGVVDLPPANQEEVVKRMWMSWGRNADGTEPQETQSPAKKKVSVAAPPSSGKAKKSAAATVPTPVLAPAPTPASVKKPAQPPAPAVAKKPAPAVAQAKAEPRQSSRQPAKRKYLAEEEEEKPAAKQAKSQAKPKAKAKAKPKKGEGESKVGKFMQTKTTKNN